MSTRSEDLSRVVRALRLNGLLLESDSALPSVVNVVTREPVRGSWWRHEDANRIYAITQHLVEEPDALLTKLLSGKLTYVHRRLWPPFISIAVSRQPWQLRDLSVTARWLLRAVNRHHEIATNDLPRVEGSQRIGDAVRELERRLLVHSKEVHTQSGAHAKVLTTWEQWIQRAGPLGAGSEPNTAKQEFERLVAALNRTHNGNARLPWPAIGK